MENPSTVPLNTKLGVTEGISMALLHAPSDFDWAPPPGVRLDAPRSRSRRPVVLGVLHQAFNARASDRLARPLIVPAGRSGSRGPSALRVS